MLLRRNLAVALLVVMSFGVAGCGKSSEPEAVNEIIAEASVEATVETSQESAAKEAGEDVSVKDEAQDEAVKEVSGEESTAAASEKGSMRPDNLKEQEGSIEKEDSNSDAGEKETSDGQKEASPQPQQPAGYGRILFCGDSRTVDMFSEPLSEIRNEVHDGIPVYCKDGCKYEYMVNAVDEYGMDNFDTLVSWMGCNNYGDFSQYGPYYEQLLSQGKKLVLLTVGPTVNEYLDGDFDKEYYTNDRQIKFNDSLKAWANGKDVKVIDMYSYIDNAMNNSGGIIINPTDGIHYYPQPNPDLWSYILSNLK